MFKLLMRCHVSRRSSDEVTWSVKFCILICLSFSISHLFRLYFIFFSWNTERNFGKFWLFYVFVFLRIYKNFLKGIRLIQFNQLMLFLPLNEMGIMEATGHWIRNKIGILLILRGDRAFPCFAKLGWYTSYTSKYFCIT